MACRVEELPGVGNYIEYRIHDRSVLIVRESTDSIRAYHNACRHRGTRLASGRGRVGSIICPFHGWRWNLDGSIKLVARRGRVHATLGRRPRSPGGPLRAVGRLRVHQHGPGCAAAARVPRSDPDDLRAVPVRAHARTSWFKGTIVPCNWKTVLDGFLEAYHVPGTHPQISRYDKTNDNLVTLRELEAAHAWSPTTVFERHAKYQSAGRKRTQSTESRREKDPAKRPAEGAPDDDPRGRRQQRGVHLPTSCRALETERSVRAARTAADRRASRKGCNAGQYHIELYRRLSIDEGYDWPEITPAQWAAAGTAWNVFPNTILLPNQGSVHRLPGTAERSRSGQLRSSRSFCLEQIPVRRLRQEVGHRAGVQRGLPTDATSARSSRRTWRTPRT